jgi:radical SAM protein with 4Fe4S-binding SPASM domain
MKIHKLLIARDVAGWKGLFFLGVDFLRTRSLPKKVSIKPRALQIEVTNLCNLRCEMCYINDLKREQLGSMTFENFKKIIDKNFNYWHTIKLWGIGEPFVNKDIFKMIEYEKSKGRYVVISTNGNLLTRDICEKIVDSGLDRLLVSVDAATPKLYNRIRRGGNFKRLISNLKALNKVIEKKGRGPIVSFTTVAMKENVKELYKIVKLASTLKIKRMLVQEVQLSKPGIMMSNQQKINDLEDINHILKDVYSYGRKHGVLVIIPEIRIKTKRESCVSPWMQAYVTWDGLVTPCCRNISSSHYVCGNLFKENMNHIWNNKKYKTFREMLKTGEPLPAICQGCTML